MTLTQRLAMPLTFGAPALGGCSTADPAVERATAY